MAEPSSSATSRRALIKKLGVGAGVVWSAPAIEALAAPSPAAAQSAPVCACTSVVVTHIGFSEGRPAFRMAVVEDCGAVRVVFETIGGTPIGINFSVPVTSIPLASYPVNLSANLRPEFGGTILATCPTVNFSLAAPGVFPDDPRF